MEYEEISHDGLELKWSAQRDSEHPDFILICPSGEIWVQVERTEEIEKYDKLYNDGKSKYPLPLSVVQQLVSQIVEKGYLEKYFSSDVGLIFTDKGQLIEN